MYLQERATVTLLGPPQAPTTAASSSSLSSSSTSAIASPTPVEHSFVAPVQSPTSTPSAAAAAKVASASSKSSIIEPIVGGVIGGGALIALCVFLFLAVMRRKKQRKRGSGFTPILGSPANGTEKFAMDDSPDLEESGKRRSGGVFAPFGGYHKTPSVESRHSNSIDMEDIEDAPIPDPEKSALVAPKLEEHPALHPLPGVSQETPTYYPGGPRNPAYNTLPSQRGRRHKLHVSPPEQFPLVVEPEQPEQPLVPEESPEIPDLEFSPVELLPRESFDDMDTVPLTPHAELAAFPPPPKGLVPQFSKKGRHLTPPRNPIAKPRRISTPPRHSLPLDRLTPLTSHTHPSPPRPPPPKKSQTAALSISTSQRIPTPRPLRPRTLTYPSPTAGGRPELPASLPPTVSRTPKNPPQPPAFHHISLPSPYEPQSATSVRRYESRKKTGSIPIGFTAENNQEQQQQQQEDRNWPLKEHPVTSDAHHLRDQPSNISDLSAIRDLQNSSAVSDLSSAPEQEAELEGHRVSVRHLNQNHSTPQKMKNEHVMSWQNYSHPGSPIIIEAQDEVSPMFSPPVTAGGNGVVSPMQSPAFPGQVEHRNWYRDDSLCLDPDSMGMAERMNIQVGLTPMIGGKTFSKRSLEQRQKDLREEFGDLSVQPLNPGRREGMRKTANRKSTF